MFKTGLAVILAVYICELFAVDNIVFAAVAAILAVQPSLYRTWKQLPDQLITNTLGASISLFFIYFLGENPVSIGIVVMIMISLSLKFKMESTIPITLVTVAAIMTSGAAGDVYFALERFLVILIGTISGIFINLAVFRPEYKKSFSDNIQSAFQQMSLLLRTAISNELTEKSYQEISKNFKKELEMLESQFGLFNEERVKFGKSKAKQLNDREIIVFRQMMKTLNEGEQLLDKIENHYFQSKTEQNINHLYDQYVEELIKYHEYLILKYQGKIKEYQHSEEDMLSKRNEFYHTVLDLYQEDHDKKLRLVIVSSALLEYTFHLGRLDQLLNQYQN
ncbi:FUSC family protein [Jeotgalibacillus salarius]|uniref:FUSC family protein n=1 Tax=Jeotgalibacillus salarius TaxID=546023 RepID=UPI002444FD76|nr:aromatic acid exporter family protein [Jeotgalibacillus salarius]